MTHSIHELAVKVLEIVLRKQLAQSPDCLAAPCPLCMAPHLPKVITAIENNEPIRFVLAGFPFKAPSSAKTLGSLPDMAEKVALRHLSQLAEDVKRIYPIGAEIIIGSDGRLFNDLFQVGEEEVGCYFRTLSLFAGQIGPTTLRLYNLDSLFPDQEGAGKHLLELESLESLHDMTHKDPLFLRRINGTERFLQEDLRTVYPELTATQLQKRARDSAYQVVQHSLAFGTVLDTRFSEAVRLSIHTHPPHSGKLGICLNSRADRGTPWHCVAVLTGIASMGLHESTSFQFMRRDEAERAGYELITLEGQPDYFDVGYNNY